jgi:hypothetical protein
MMSGLARPVSWKIPIYYGEKVTKIQVKQNLAMSLDFV